MPEIDDLLTELKGWASEERGRQAIIAQALGVSKQAVSTWLSGKSIPNWATGERIKAFLKAQKPRKMVTKA
jgi:DNA-binding XRE family transcriptional regulator